MSDTPTTHASPSAPAEYRPPSIVADPESFVGARPAQPGEFRTAPLTTVQQTADRMRSEGNWNTELIDTVESLLRRFAGPSGAQLGDIMGIIDEMSGTTAAVLGEVIMKGPTFVQVPGTQPRQWVNVDDVVALTINPNDNSTIILLSTGITIDAAVAPSVVLDALTDPGDS